MARMRATPPSSATLPPDNDVNPMMRGYGSVDLTRTRRRNDFLTNMLRASVAVLVLAHATAAHAATTINITTSVTAGAGDAYADDEILVISSTGSVDFSPETERFGSIQGVTGSAVTLGNVRRIG